MMMRLSSLMGVLVALGLPLLGLVFAAPGRAAVSVETVVSPQGVSAYLATDRALPIVSVSVVLPAGSAYDPPGREGLATLMARLLDEGAGDLDAQAFQRRLEEQAIDLSFDPGVDTLTVALRTTTDTLDEAFGVLALALARPRFDSEAVERMRAAQLALLRRQAGDPGELARRAWFAKVFPGHPYGHDSEGTEDSVRALSREDLRAFAQNRLTREALAIGVAGDIDAPRLAVLLDRTFGGLPEKAGGASIPAVTPVLEGTLERVPLALSQSTALLGQTGPRRQDPEWQAAFVVNHILGGGGFSSRLMDEVREKRGLAYSVYSALYPFREAGLWIAGTATESARLPESLSVMKEQWAKMASEGPSDEEIKDAKTYLTGAWPLRFTSTQGVASMLASMRYYALPPTYIEDRNGLIEALTRDDLGSVARKFLDPERLTTVVVGPPMAP